MQTNDQDQRFTQRRRRLKTSFTLKRKHLHFGFESKDRAALQRKIAWDSIAPRVSYSRTTEPDDDLRWLGFVLTALALAASLRGGPQPLTFLLHLGVTLVLLGGLSLTHRWRSVGYTTLSAAGTDILVLHDRQHDAIVSAIEARRTAALQPFAEPVAGLTMRTYLRRLRWLVENGILTRDEFLQRQKLLLPGSAQPLLPPEAVSEKPLHVSQSRCGNRVEVELKANHLVYRRRTLFGGAEGFGVPYRDLPEPSVHEETNHQYDVLGGLFAWTAIGVIAWMSAITQSQPASHYVGGSGLRHAIADFGPAFLILIVAACALPPLTRLRCARPYPGILLLRDRHYDAILAAIEERRIAALRQLVRPDPLLTLNEQMQTLDELREADIISGDEYQQAAQRAAAICDDPALDAPVTAARQASREYMLH